ncbi:unnamed protein product, partial [Allacma fusca]
MSANGPKDAKKVPKDSKDPQGEKDERENQGRSESANHRSKDQIVRDVKDAIKDVKDALKEYRQGEPEPHQQAGSGMKDNSDPRNEMSSNSSPSNTPYSTTTNSAHSREIKSALSVLQDIRMDPIKTTQEEYIKENNEANSSEFSKSDDEDAHSPDNDIKFSGTGSYIFHTSEGVDEYLKQLGVGLVFRKVQSVANPSLTIYPCKCNEWGIKIDSIFRTREIKFQLGEEFTDETYDGRPCRSVATIEAINRLYIRQRCPAGPDVKDLSTPHNSIRRQAGRRVLFPDSSRNDAGSGNSGSSSINFGDDKTPAFIPDSPSRESYCTTNNGERGECHHYSECALFMPQFFGKGQRTTDTVQCQLQDGSRGMCCKTLTASSASSPVPISSRFGAQAASVPTPNVDRNSIEDSIGSARIFFDNYNSIESRLLERNL